MKEVHRLLAALLPRVATVSQGYCRYSPQQVVLSRVAHKLDVGPSRTLLQTRLCNLFEEKEKERRRKRRNADRTAFKTVWPNGSRE